MAENLWEKAEADLRAFNERYDEVHRYYDSDNVEALDKLLNQFAFRKNGTAPSFMGSGFYEWFQVAFPPGDPVKDPEGVRPGGRMILDVIDGKVEITGFFTQLDAYRDALQAAMDATAPQTFSYQGFTIGNPQHMGDSICRQLLEGVDYLVALFKKRGLEKLLKGEIKRVDLQPDLGEKTHGLYHSNTQTISLSAKIVTTKARGRFIQWVNEVFLHEFGHHVHMNYITGEARAVWDEGWTEVQQKKDALAEAFQKITHEERAKFFEVLESVGFDPGKAAKKLPAVSKVKFGVWLRTPMTGTALITDKQFRLTKDGQYVMSFFRDPVAFMKEHYDLSPNEENYKVTHDRRSKQMLDKLGLLYSGAYSIPANVVEELSKADPSMNKAVEEALAKLEIVSGYGKENEKEDFAETFVAFVGAPEKLTPTATYRMKRTLSVSGLYGKPVMQLAKRVAERFKTANVVPFKPKKPSGPTLLISGRKYVLSDYFPMLSGLAEEQTAPGGARLITTGPPRFSYLWAYDTDKKFVAMWRVSDGDEKAGGSASHYTSDVVALERKGQLNRVTHEEFRAIERYMSEQYHDTMAALKKYIAENANEWDKEAKEIAKELFEEKFLPRILAKFHEVEQGVTPLGFKVNEHMLSHRSPEDQAKMFVSQPILKDYTLQAVDEFAKKKGIDPDNPPGDIQALDWGRHEVLDEFYEKFFK